MVIIDGDNAKLTRAYLYRIIAENIEPISKRLLSVENVDYVKNVFEDSATFIEYFEKDLYRDGDYSSAGFNDLLSNAFLSIKEPSFKKSFREGLLKETHYKLRGENTMSYKGILAVIIRALANYHDALIKKTFYAPFLGESNHKPEMPQTFLSYAYIDKGITLGLYLYFLINGGFLYVNWMWEGTNPNASLTKETLDRELSKSNQLLFLRTPNSDLDYYDKHQIRQWCSWEIGNFYTKSPNNKFYLNFYGQKNDNDLLDSFLEFRGIQNGIMHG